MTECITIATTGQGLYEFTDQVKRIVEQSRVGDGLCTLFVQHTSASILIQENADPSVGRDLQNWLSRLVGENDALFTHTAEGPDDMPSHIKGALTAVSLSIPIVSGRLGLGTWQGIFLWEHRRRPMSRHCLVHIAD